MALPGQEFEIELDGSSIRYRKWTSGGTEQWSYFPVANINSVVPTEIDAFGTRQADNNRKNSTRLTDKLNIQINFVDDDIPPLSFDIQNVMNQAGWTPDSAGLTQALNDINDWITSASGSTASTDALIQDLVDQNAANGEPDQIDVVFVAGVYTFPSDTYFSASIVVKSGDVTMNSGTIPWPAPSSVNVGVGPNGFVQSFTLNEVTPAEVFIIVTSKQP